MTTLHLDFQYRNQHFLRRRTAMHIILASTGDLEHIAADRERNHFCIIVIQGSPHGDILNAFVDYRLLCHDESTVDKGFLIANSTDFVALR